MDFESMPPDVKFMFGVMMSAALKAKSMGETKKVFVSFASECWDSMLLNDVDTLQKLITSSMIDDIKNFVENEEE